MKKKRGSPPPSRDDAGRPQMETSQHFTLDDIMREFGSSQPEPSGEEPEIRATAPWSSPIPAASGSVPTDEHRTQTSPEGENSVPPAGTNPADSGPGRNQKKHIGSSTVVIPTTGSTPGSRTVPGTDSDQTIAFPGIKSGAEEAPAGTDTRVLPQLGTPELQRVPRTTTQSREAPASRKPAGSSFGDGGPKSETSVREKPDGGKAGGQTVIVFTRETAPQEQQKQPDAPPGPPKKKVTKQKPLVTPEVRYRRAVEGQGSRNIRLILCGLFTLMSLVLGIFRCQGLLDHYDGQGLLSFGELALLLLCSLFAFDVLVSGLGKILTLRFDFSTLLSVEVILGVIHSFLCLKEQKPGYAPLICLALTCGLWGLTLQKSTIAHSMDAARKSGGRNALMKEPDLFLKQWGILRGKGSMQTFLEEFERPGLPERLLNLYALLVLVAGLVGAILSPRENTGLLGNWLIISLAGTPLCGFLVVARPWSILARRLGEKGAALHGWVGAKRLSGKVCVPVSGKELFPGDHVKLNGIKYFGGANPDRVVSYMAAIMETVGSDIAHLFQEQVEIRGARRHMVSRFRRYESGGVNAEIGLDSVLVGSLRFMQSMGVEMPAGTRVSQAIYMAIDGELAGVFALQYTVTKASAEALGALSMMKHITPLITAGDFVITESFLRSRFRVDTTRVLFPHLNVRAELARAEGSPNAKPCALIKDESFSAKALCVAGSRALTTAIIWGFWVALAGGCMGLSIMTVLTFLETQSVISLTNLVLYQLIWAVPGLLLSGWTRNV